MHTTRRDTRPRRHGRRPPPRLSLSHALLVAADHCLAPPLHVDNNDISFTYTNPFDWPLYFDQEYTTAGDGDGDGDDPHHHHYQQQEQQEQQPSGRVFELQSLITLHITHLTKSATGHNPYTTSTSFTPPTTTTQKDNETLAEHGYDATHLQKWIDILTHPDSLHAATLLTGGASATQESNLHHHNTVPAFVYLYFIRRQHITPQALRLTIDYFPTWFAILTAPKPYNADGSDTLRSSLPSDHPSNLVAIQGLVFRAYLRLLRHTRRVWPEATEVITHHLVSRLRLPTPPRVNHDSTHDPDSSTKLATLTAHYNRALYLIGEPVHVEPFKNLLHQEAAQALVLNHMADHVPPLIITREGYRGVMRVQLAREKTPHELQWASLKSQSWPPWKEDRTGMDADVGIENGISRARQVINRMQEAGYGMQDWERTVLIYAGWDTDLSPTIQTRALMPRNPVPHCPTYIWAARIRSTRTVQEAWAAFLSYEDDHLTASQDVYLAMFEKLIEEEKRLRLDHAYAMRSRIYDADLDPIYPGDIKEVLPPPASDHQATYTRVPPPSVPELHKRMLSRHLVPVGRLLAYLVNRANTMDEGLVYLRSSETVYKNLVQHFTTAKKSLAARPLQVPNEVFAAIVGLLVRFPHLPLVRRHNKEPYIYSFGGWSLDIKYSLGRAIFLLDQDRRHFRPAWYGLLRGFARRTSPSIFTNLSSPHPVYGPEPDPTPETEDLDRMVSYNLTKHLLSTMRDMDLTLDPVGFRYFCIIVEHAAKAAAQILARHAVDTAQAGLVQDVVSSKQNHGAIDPAKHMAQEANYVTNQFWTMVGCEGANPNVPSSASVQAGFALPRLLAIPNPAILHAYIRALGFLRDYQGLVELVAWMRMYWDELSARKEQDRNGLVVFRRCIVALRVFLEGHWEEELHRAHHITEMAASDQETTEQGRHDYNDFGAPPELRNQAQDYVENIDDWGGWATEAEVDAYLERRV